MDKKEFKFHVNNYRNGTIVFDEQGITYRQNISATAEEVDDIKHCYIPYGSINSIRISLGTPTIRFKIMKDEHIYERSIFFQLKRKIKKYLKPFLSLQNYKYQNPHQQLQLFTIMLSKLKTEHQR